MLVRQYVRQSMGVGVRHDNSGRAFVESRERLLCAQEAAGQFSSAPASPGEAVFAWLVERKLLP
jgi:hypothetical protein